MFKLNSMMLIFEDSQIKLAMKYTKSISRSFSASSVGLVLSSITLLSTLIAPGLANDTLDNNHSQLTPRTSEPQSSKTEYKSCHVKSKYFLDSDNNESSIAETLIYPGIVPTISMINSNPEKTNIADLLKTTAEYNFEGVIKWEKDKYEKKKDGELSNVDLFDYTVLNWCCPCPIDLSRKCCFC